MATSVEDAVARLTDFSQPMDVAVFEQLVAVAYAPGNPQQQASGHALVHLQEHPGVSPPAPVAPPLSRSSPREPHLPKKRTPLRLWMGTTLSPGYSSSHARASEGSGASRFLNYSSRALAETACWSRRAGYRISLPCFVVTALVRVCVRNVAASGRDSRSGRLVWARSERWKSWWTRCSGHYPRRHGAHPLSFVSSFLSLSLSF